MSMYNVTGVEAADRYRRVRSICCMEPFYASLPATAMTKDMFLGCLSIQPSIWRRLGLNNEVISQDKHAFHLQLP